MANAIIPRLYVKSGGESTTKLSLSLTKAPRRFVVRLTGGCGNMSGEDAEGLYDLFAEAFAGFNGALIFGGTRMVPRDDTSNVVPSITEIPAQMRESCPDMMTLGVIPRTQELGISKEGLIVSDNAAEPYFTIAHPQQDIALLVQVSADHAEVWDAEYQESARIIEDLREYAGFQSLLVVYNGGSVTERELLLHAKRGWSVLLIRNSGRKADEYAANAAFLAQYPNVQVAERDAQTIRSHLALAGALPRQNLLQLHRRA